jgi:hypothetical protein
VKIYLSILSALTVAMCAAAAVIAWVELDNLLIQIFVTLAMVVVSGAFALAIHAVIKYWEEY